jgi:opacity protein-like surface antigen
MLMEGPVRILKLPLLVGLLFALSALPARADGFISPFVGFHFGGDSTSCSSTTITNCQGSHVDFGAAIGIIGSHLFGFEEELAYAQDFFPHSPSEESSVFTAMSNLMISFPAGPFRPYAVGGFGLVRPHVKATINPAGQGGDTNALGYDIGAGLNIFFVPHVAIRGDIRHIHTIQDVSTLHLGTLVTGQTLDYNRASAGVTFTF